MEPYQISWMMTLLFAGLSLISYRGGEGQKLRFLFLCLAYGGLFVHEWFMSPAVTLRLDLLLILPLLAVATLSFLLTVAAQSLGRHEVGSLALIREWRLTYDALVPPTWIASVLAMQWMGEGITGLRLFGHLYWVVPGVMMGGVLLNRIGVPTGRYLFLFTVPIEALHVSVVAMGAWTVNDWLASVQSLVGLFYLVGFVTYGTLVSEGPVLDIEVDSDVGDDRTFNRSGRNDLEE